MINYLNFSLSPINKFQGKPLLIIIFLVIKKPVTYFTDRSLNFFKNLFVFLKEKLIAKIIVNAELFFN